MAKKKLSRDQKRKHKLQKRSAPSAAPKQSPADAFMRDTERIIHETFLSFGRAMRDADALAAVNQLVVDVQQGNVARDNQNAESPLAKGALVWNIKQHWADTHALGHLPTLVAAQVLQALAQRIDGIKSVGESHSYLRFLQGTQETAALAATEPPTNGDWSPDEARLLAAGLTWLRASSEETWTPFRDEATRMTNGDQAQAVANVCQYLYGLVQAEPVELALRPLLHAAHQKLAVE